MLVYCREEIKLRGQEGESLPWGHLWATYLCQCLGHVKCPDSVHVRGNDWDSIVAVFGVSENKLAMEVDLEETGASFAHVY